jgi:excisionase family DNA binding protein
LTVPEIAERLELKQQPVRDWIDNGDLPAVWSSAGHVCVRESDLHAFFAANATRRLQSEKGDPWQPVGKATRAVTAAMREQDPDALEHAITNLAVASRQTASALRAEAR